MSASASILIYGRDFDLLETRGWVLERAGYRICHALELQKVKEMLADQPIDLLLLCHSLSPEECEEALALAAAHDSKMKRLLVTANTVVVTSAVNEATVSAFAGPRGMISAVQAVLGTEDDAGKRSKRASSASD